MEAQGASGIVFENHKRHLLLNLLRREGKLQRVGTVISFDVATVLNAVSIRWSARSLHYPAGVVIVTNLDLGNLRRA